MRRIPKGRSGDPCPITGRPHEWDWYGTQTHRCRTCAAFVWFLNAALEPADLERRPNGLVEGFDREVFEIAPDQPGDGPADVYPSTSIASTTAAARATVLIVGPAGGPRHVPMRAALVDAGEGVLEAQALARLVTHAQGDTKIDVDALAIALGARIADLVVWFAGGRGVPWDVWRAIGPMARLGVARDLALSGLPPIIIRPGEPVQLACADCQGIGCPSCGDAGLRPVTGDVWRF